MPDVPTYSDARTSDGRSALVRFDDAAVMFTATWGEPSINVPRPDGSRKRQYVVRLTVPVHHLHRPFHQSRSITLYETAKEPLSSDDFGGVQARAADSVTLAWFIGDDSRPELDAMGGAPQTLIARPASSASKPTK